MKPAQEAKEFAAAHGFAISPRGRRYYVGYIELDGNEIEIADVGGYPAALNAMKRYVEDRKSDVVVASLEGHGVVKIIRAEVENARVAGADVQVIPTSPESVDTSVIGTTCGFIREPNESDGNYIQRITETLKRESHAPSEILKPHGLFLVGDRKPRCHTSPGPEFPWRVWQRSSDGNWHALLAFGSRAAALKYCRVIANVRSLHNLAREIRYEG